MSAPFNTVYADGGPPIIGDGLNTFLQNCASVDQARGFIGTLGMVMFLQGFNVANDGGQGMFFWNPTGVANDDGGITTIVPFGSAPGSGEWTRIATAAQGMLGTTTNDNAPPGYVGEFISSSLPQASAIGLTTEVGAEVTSISLTGGDWDVRGVVAFKGTSATTMQFIQTGITTAGPFMPGDGGEQGNCILWLGGDTPFVIVGFLNCEVAPARVSLAPGATTLFLVGAAGFTAGPCSAWGSIYARRVR